jgi:hypothetical protein
MAPEQALGKRGRVTTAVDIYGLRTILYAALTERPPFQNHSVLETIEEVRDSDPEIPSLRNPAIPKDLEAICLKCLEKSPQDRYYSTAELIEDLLRFLGDIPVVARPVGKARRFLRWARRHPGLMLLSTSLAVLTIFLVGGSIAAAVMLSDKNAEVLESLAAETKDKWAAEESDQLAQQALYETRKQQVRALRLSGLKGQRVGGLKTIDQAAEMISRLNLDDRERLELRNEAIAAMSLVDLSESQCWPTENDLVATSKDLTRYLQVERDQERISIHDFATNQRLFQIILEEPGRILTAQFTRADQYVALLLLQPDRQTVWQVWDVEQSRAVLTTGQCFIEKATTLDISPDGKRLAVMLKNRTIEVRSLPGGNLLRTTRPTKYSVGLSVSDQADSLLTYGNATAWISDLTTGKVLSRIKMLAELSVVRISPDGGWVAVPLGCWLPKTRTRFICPCAPDKFSPRYTRKVRSTQSACSVSFWG